MKYLKFIVILMGLLIFFGTAGVIYIIYDRVFSKLTLVFPEKKVLNELIYAKEDSHVLLSQFLNSLILFFKKSFIIYMVLK